MNRAQLLQHFDTLAETPDAVAKLRDLVLQLAVRGNLVPQNDKEESGAELLKRILEEKRRLTREGVIKKTLVLEFIAFDACPFEIPKNWAWTYLNDFGDWGSGSTPNRSNHEFYDGTIPWLKSGELNDGIVSESEEKVTELALEKCSLRLNKPGDVLLAMYGATVGKVATLGVEATTNQAVCACTCFSGVFNRYLFFLLKAFKQQFISESAGAAQPNFSKDKIIRTVAPLPPLTEQRRIVAKVEELLALCDELEAAQTAAREHRTRLVRSALDHLTSSSRSSRREPALTDPKTGKSLSGLTSAATRIGKDNFQQHAAFVLQHSDLVLDSVSDLRKVILSLAVQGRVESQNPKDESAFELLKQIGKERERLVAEKKLGASPRMKTKDLPTNPLPKGWVWAPFGEVTFCRDGERIPVNSDERESLAKTYDYYGASGVIDKIDRYLFDTPLLLIGEDGANLINRSTPIAFIAEGKYWVNNHAHVLDTINRTLMEYLCIYINSINLEAYITGMAQPKMNQAQMNSIPIALPPLAEQQRIVAKVDELMRWCDALEARLTAAQTTATHLLDATLHQILAA